MSLTRVPGGRRLVCAAAGAAMLLAGCSNAAVDKAAGQGAGAGIAVTTSGDAVTIENRTTRPLLNVRVSVSAGASGGAFVRVVPTIDTNRSEQVRLNDCQAEDGTLLDPAVNAPQRVSVAARDTLGNSYSANASW